VVLCRGQAVLCLTYLDSCDIYRLVPETVFFPGGEVINLYVLYDVPSATGNISTSTLAIIVLFILSLPTHILFFTPSYSE
jgi:hypothetical protein